jgi:hypothetical protein
MRNASVHGTWRLASERTREAVDEVGSRLQRDGQRRGRRAVSAERVTAGDERWSSVERALLDAALDFFDAAQEVIDYTGAARPRLRHDLTGLQAVRKAMGTLEAQFRSAHETGLSSERIAKVTRLEREIVELIVGRHRASLRDSDERRAGAG